MCCCCFDNIFQPSDVISETPVKTSPLNVCFSPGKSPDDVGIKWNSCQKPPVKNQNQYRRNKPPSLVSSCTNVIATISEYYLITISNYISAQYVPPGIDTINGTGLPYITLICKYIDTIIILSTVRVI